MSAVDLEKVRDQVELLRWVAAREKELKEVKARARGIVEDALGGAEVGTLDGETAVTWSKFKKRQFDKAALESEHPDIVAEYTKLVESSRFEVL